MAREIHQTAIIGKKVVIEEGAEVGPFCVLKGKVRIKKGTRLISHVVIEGNTEIGEECTVYPFVSIGLPPQDLKYKNEDTGVVIGDRNIIREHVTIHRASVGGDYFTVVGNDNFLMAYVHIAHDCKVGSHIVMANAATLAGHVTIEDYAVLGGIVAVHQFARIGAYAMIGGMTAIPQDVPPYTVASGERAKLFGLNAIGIKRRGFSETAIAELKKAYKILFREKHTMKAAIKKVQKDLPDTAEIRHLIEFIENNKRGICR